MAYKIEQERIQKTYETEHAAAELTRLEKETELKRQAVEIEREKLNVEIREKAAAEKDRAIAEAEAEKYRRQAEADAALYAAQKEAEARELAKKLEKITLTFKVNSGAEGRVFGSVSTKQITEALNKQDIKVDKKKFLDTQPIQTLGVTKVRIELYRNVIGTVNVQLIGSDQ
jgi:ribosomal protein L9